jgi:ankyrin repeat protein
MPGNRAARLAFVMIVIVILILIGRNFYRRYLNSALVKAIQNTDVSTVRSLLERGADPNYRYVDPSVESRMAIPLPMLDMAFTKLVQSGVSGYSPFADVGPGGIIAASAPDAGAEAIVCLLIRKGARIKGQNYLETACRLGDVAIARCLLENGTQSNTLDNSSALGTAIDYRTSFHTGITNGRRFSMTTTPEERTEVARRQDVSRQLVQLLRAHGAHLTLTQAQEIGDRAAITEALKRDAHAGSLDGYVALATAARAGDLETMRQLLEQGVDPDRQPIGQPGNSALWALSYSAPLYSAAEGGRLDAVKLLLAHSGASDQAAMNREMALSVAARSGNLAMAALLLAHGANPNPKEQNVEPALYAAAGAGSIEMAKLLLAHGANVNPVGQFAPLGAAIAGRHPAMVRFLLAHAANPNAPNDYSILTVALRSLPEVMPDLIEHGASVTPGPLPHGTGGVEPLSPLMAALFYAPQYEAMLVKAGARIGPDRPTICAVAARRRRLDLLPKLLAYGADINGIGSNRETALAACIDHSPADVRMLLEHGANPNLAASEGRTLLEEAVMTGNAATVRLLLAHGADPNTHAARGHAPLYWARKKNHADIVALLVQAGAKD